MEQNENEEANNFNEFKFDSEEFYEQILEIIVGSLQDEEKIANLELVINNIPIFYWNKIKINEFLNFLHKMSEHKENLRQFLILLDKINVKSGVLQNIISKSLIKFLQKYLENLDDKKEKNKLNFAISLNILKTIFDGGICDAKHQKISKNILNYISHQITKNIKYETELTEMLNKNKNKINYIFLFGNLLQNEKISTDFRNIIEKTFFNYYENQILNDEEREKKLAKQRLLTNILNYFKNESYIDHLIKSCESLLIRSLSNYKFLENIFTFYKPKNQDNTLFNVTSINRFKEYFFNLDKNISESSYNSFNYFSKLCDRKSLLNSLCEMNFTADKAELNFHVCNYLTFLLLNLNKIEFTDQELLKICYYCIKKLDSLNENNRSKFELIFENLLDGLYKYTGKSNEKPNNELIDNLNNQMKKLLTSSNFSYFYNYIYMIITYFPELINKQVYDILFTLLSNANVSNTNIKNPLALISSCLTLVNLKGDLFNTGNNKKNLTQALQNCFITSNLFHDFQSNDYLFYEKLKISSLDFINFLNIYQKIIFNETLNSHFSDNIEFTQITKIISQVLFRTNKKNVEEIFFKNFLNKLNDLKEKNHCDSLINQIFIFILNKESTSVENKISFHKISSLLGSYSNFYQEFNDKDFIKFTILIHIPNMENDIHIQKKINFSNKYIQKFYTKFSNLETNKDYYVELENNFKNLSLFVFSDLGLFNKKNKFIHYSCLNILTKMSESLSHPQFSTDIVKNCINSLNEKKLKFLDDIIEYYTKQVEYISFYDLTSLVESLQGVEKDYSQSLNCKNEEPQTQNISQNVNLKQQQKSNKPQQQTQTKKPNTKQPEQKVDKETKLKELKTYFEKYLINLSVNSNFTYNTLSPIFDLFNNIPIQKENLKLVIKHLWKLLKIENIQSVTKENLYKLFTENKLSKQLALEFSNLMYLQANPKKFDTVLENQPNLVINFNEKLEHILNSTANDGYVHQLFEYYDYVIIKILFFIILNAHISNEDKISSVSILIKIIQNINEQILNFNDISLLAVSLLKTSYNHDNLANLLDILLKRSREENFLVLCDDILEYEYVAKVTFLQQILNLNMISLRKYRNLVYKIWILIFDENDNISQLSSEIWNKFNLYLDPHFVNSEELKMAFTNHKLKDSVNRAIRAYTFILPKEAKSILEKYEEFYEKELTEFNVTKESEDYDQDEDTDPHLRMILLDFINETTEVFSSQMKSKLLDFFMRVSENEFNSDIFREMNTTIYNIINSIEQEDLIENILNSIEKNVKNVISASQIGNLNQLKIILMLLNSILKKNEKNKDSIIKKQTSESLYESLKILSDKLSNIPHNNEALVLVSSCYQYLAKENILKSEALLKKFLENCTTEGKNKFLGVGEMYVVAGIVKCFGISSYKTYKIDEIIKENMKKNKTIYEKQNSVVLIRVFSETLKKLFEPYLVANFDQICELIADRDDKVRDTTQKVVKTFMKNLSGYAVKTIMPRLIKDLHSMNWRSKVVNIELLGQFAFCAPKQLSIYIPKVIKEIMTVFKDPHPKVQETAISVLKDISSVIKNPEIVELSDLLIDAVSNPYEKSKNALVALLETNFRHAIDPPSLALIIPIVDYNLKVQSESLKKMAAHVIGSVANLIVNPTDIYQYIDIIIPNLKIALFDAIPECRNAMAKAIGALTKNLGLSYLNEMMSWLSTFLENNSETVERSGSAQAYSEILVAFGETFIEQQLPHIVSKIQDNNHIVKEGYLSIFVFLPGCLTERFEKYFELIFPLIIEGFSDDHENVRNVSNKIFEICIKLYAKRNTKQLVDPLLVRLFDTNWRIRNSSIALISILYF